MEEGGGRYIRFVRPARGPVVLIHEPDFLAQLRTERFFYEIEGVRFDEEFENDPFDALHAGELLEIEVFQS